MDYINVFMNRILNAWVCTKMASLVTHAKEGFISYLRQVGYVFAWVCLWVCEFVCEQDTGNSKTYGWILMKFSGYV